MATLSQMPSQQVIDGYKGKIDFYLWLGLPCARKWPVYKPRTPTQAEKANQDRFAAINSAWRNIDPVSRQAFQDMATGTGLTARDMYVRTSMKGAYRHPVV